MPDYLMGLLPLWACGLFPASLLWSLWARRQPGSVQSRARLVKARTFFWPVTLLLALGTVLAVLCEGYLAFLVTTPADRREAKLEAAEASLRKAKLEAAASERELARVTAELERQQAGEPAASPFVEQLLQDRASLSGAVTSTNWANPEVGAFLLEVLRREAP